MLADTLPPQRTWPTLAWAGAGAFALILAQLLGVLIYVAGVRLTHASHGVSAIGILHSGLAILDSTVISSALVAAFLWGLTRFRTCDVADYLALRWPAPRQVLTAMGAFIGFLMALALLSHWFEPSSDVAFMMDLVSSARAAHAIPLVVEAVILAAPLGEELAFRGFLYRTLELRFGPNVAIVATAVGWAALHIQYSFVGMGTIFACGLFFGAVRRYSGSLYMTILLHALWNAAALAGAFMATAGV